MTLLSNLTSRYLYLARSWQKSHFCPWNSFCLEVSNCSFSSYFFPPPNPNLAEAGWHNRNNIEFRVNQTHTNVHSFCVSGKTLNLPEPVSLPVLIILPLWIKWENSWKVKHWQVLHIWWLALFLNSGTIQTCLSPSPGRWQTHIPPRPTSFLQDKLLVLFSHSSFTPSVFQGWFFPP